MERRTPNAERGTSNVERRTRVGPRVPRGRRSGAVACLVVALGTLLTAQTDGGRIALTDVTREAGITARHDNGAAGRKLLPETMGAGAAFLDSPAWSGTLTRR